MTLQFESPRFAGDALLEDILNDPDTGQKKLQAGSPPDSVIRLQQALFDLFWVFEVDPNITEADFVIGTYGPKTTETVRRYKEHYDIHFPPSDPTGFIDGLAGPRTFQKLDPQCVLIDEAEAAINAKAVELSASGITIEPLATRAGPIYGTSGARNATTIADAVGEVFYKRGVGAFEVHGNIFDTYAVQQGGARGAFGFPISDEHDDGPGFRASDFEHGSMRCDLSTGVVELTGPTPGEPEQPVF